MPTSSMPMRWPSCWARIAPPWAIRALRPALAASPCALSNVPPAKSNETICDCGSDGSAKKVMRGARSVPRTFTPAFTSGNSLVARMSTPGSLSAPPVKTSRPRSMSRRRPSAAYLPSATPSSPEPRLLPSGWVMTLSVPASRPLKPNESSVTLSPRTKRMLLETRKLLSGSTGSSPTSTSSAEDRTAPVRSAGTRRA